MATCNLNNPGAAALVSQVLEGLTDLGDFSFVNYSNHIKDILQVDNNNWQNVCTSQVYNEDPDGTTALIQRFKVLTVALGVSRNPYHNFNKQVRSDVFPGKLVETSSGLVVPIYRYHLEQHLQKKGVSNTILEMTGDVNFCAAYLLHVLQPSFINDSLIARYFGQSNYTEAVAYVYERSRHTLLTPSPQQTVVMNELSRPGGILNATQVLSKRFGEIDTVVQTASNNARLANVDLVAQFLHTNLPVQWSSNQLLQKPRFQRIGEIWSTNWMSLTYSSTVVSDLISQKSTWTSGVPSMGQSPMISYSYGDQLWKWMVKQANGDYSDIFNIVDSENLSYESSGSPFGGCFAPEARLSLAHHDIPIKDLRPGDKVLVKAPHEIGTASLERVEHPTQHVRSDNRVDIVNLFGFNDERPFATASHIFWTITGPKSLVPSLSLLENDDIVVGTLQIGDTLLRLNKDRSGYDHVEIRSIKSAPAACSTIHGVHFEKGSKSNGYHVNGYWVRENYPELTIANMRGRYTKMSLSEQKSFSKLVSHLPETFRKVLGPVVHDTVKAHFSTVQPGPNAVQPGSHQSKLDMLEQATKHLPGLKNITGTYTLVPHGRLSKPGRVIDSTDLDYHKTLESFHGGKDPQRLILHQGIVASNKGLASHATVSHAAVQWSHKLSDHKDLYEHGVVRPIFHGFAVAGYTATGPARPKSMKDFTSVKAVMGMQNANTYKTECSGTTFATSTAALAANASDPDNWKTFWTVTIGLQSNGNGGVSINIKLPDLDRYYLAQHPKSAPSSPIYETTPMSYNNGKMTATVKTIYGMGGLVFAPLLKDWGKVNVTNTVTPGPAFESFTVELNIINNDIHGSYTELITDKDGDDKPGSIHALAVSEPSAMLFARDHISRLRKEVIGHSVAHLEDAHQAPLPATRMLSEKFLEADNLSISDLQTMGAPDDNSLNSTSQQYLQNASTYWRASPETDTFGNDQQATKSALPADGSLTGNLGPGERSWLGIYQRAILMQGLQRDSKYTGKFTAANTSKLDYYFQGGVKGCLAGAPEYNKVSSVCAAEAFNAYSPQLQAYVDDSKDWASAFNTFVTTNTQLNDQAFAMLLSPGSNVTNRYCMILNALSQGEKNYGVDLWNLVRDKILVSCSSGKIKTDDAPPFLEQFVEAMINKISGDNSTSLLSALNVDLQTLETEWETKDAKEIAAHLFSAQFELGQCFIKALVNVGSIIKNNKGNFAKLMDKWQAEVGKIASKSTQAKLTRALNAATGILGLAMDGFTIWESVKYFQNWGDLTDTGRAQAVIGLVQTVLRTGRDLASIIAALKGSNPADFDYKLNCIKWNRAVGAENPGGREVAFVDEDDEIRPTLDYGSMDDTGGSGSEAESISERLAATTTTEDVATDVPKTFGLSEAAGAVIGVAANVASAVSMGFQIKSDFDDGASPGIKTLDILSEVTTDLQVICGAVEIGIMVLGVESMVIPIVGFVIAFVGIVLMFVSMFVPRPKPEDPVDKYLDSNMDAFFATIPTKPDLTLKYNVVPSLKCGGPGNIRIDITNPSNSPLKFTSITVSIPAGTEDTQVFLKPSGNDNGKPTSCLVSYSLSNQTSFQVTGSPVASYNTNLLTAKITPTGSTEAAVIPPGGLSLWVNGSVNSTTGTARITVRESAKDRGTGIPNRDYYAYYDVQKS